MALQSDYKDGTISIDANGSAVTGNGTAWTAAGFQEGDLIFANGYVGVVASVDSNVAITLAQPWRGGALSGAAYRLRYQGDASRVTAQARQMINLLGASGNLQALGGVTGAAKKVPVFTGAGTMVATDFDTLADIEALAIVANKLIYFDDSLKPVLSDLRSVARDFLAANFMPVQQAGDATFTTDKVKIGWRTSQRLAAIVGANDIGAIWTDHLAPKNIASTGFQKLPNGLTVQWGASSQGQDTNINFPTSFTTVYGAVANATYQGAANNAFVANAANLTVSGFNLSIRQVIGGGTVQIPGLAAHWWAWGYIA